MTVNYPTRWEYDIKTVSKEEIRIYCIEDELWQAFRLTMKGIPTLQKLRLLEKWRQYETERGELSRRREVQIDNYINALLRGGQLKRGKDGEVYLQH